MHRSLRAVILFAVLIASTGCLGPRLAQCPAQGGRPWQEVESEHFTLQTDLPIEEATKAARYLEQTRAAILAAAWPSASTRKMARVTVYVFGQSSDFENLFPRRIAGFFSLQGDEPFIVLHGPPDTWEKRFSGFSEASSSTLKHELTHHLSTYTLLRRPHWLSEGLAEFYSTFDMANERTARLGGIRQGHIWRLQREFLPLTVLASADQDSPYYNERDKSSVFYAQSWALVHFLRVGREQKYAAKAGPFFEAVAGGMDFETACVTRLGVTPATLEEELREHLHSPVFFQVIVKMNAVKGGVGRTSLVQVAEIIVDEMAQRFRGVHENDPGRALP